jgi:hypothetical protein
VEQRLFQAGFDGAAEAQLIPLRQQEAQQAPLVRLAFQRGRGRNLAVDAVQPDAQHQRRVHEAFNRALGQAGVVGKRGVEGVHQRGALDAQSLGKFALLGDGQLLARLAAESVQAGAVALQCACSVLQRLGFGV